MGFEVLFWVMFLGFFRLLCVSFWWVLVVSPMCWNCALLDSWFECWDCGWVGSGLFAFVVIWVVELFDCGWVWCLVLAGFDFDMDYLVL